MILFLLFLSLHSSAQQNGTAKIDVSYFNEDFAKIACLEDDYLMNCFSMKKSICIRNIQDQIPYCLNQLQEKSRQKNFPLLHFGNCLGEQFEKKHSALKSSDPKCYQVSKWN